jgi:hypothetical protein
MEKEELDKRTREYEMAYIRKSDMPPARFGKSIYIRKEHHERISQIVSVIGRNELALYEYVDNVLTEHLNSHFDEIVQAFNNRKMY